jgi:hypothetical protein
MSRIKAAAKTMCFGIVAVAVVASFAAGGLRVASAAAQGGAAVKMQCPAKMAAACKKNEQRVCRQTDSKGCCVKSMCVQK